MSTEENKAVIRRWMDVWNTGELGALEEIIAPNYVRHHWGGTMVSESDPVWYAQWVAEVRTKFSDLFLSIEALIAEGDTVITRWTTTGTHRGQWTAPTGTVVPPTGKTITWTGITIARLSGGKIAEEWWEWDRLGIAQQLGAVPTPG